MDNRLAFPLGFKIVKTTGSSNTGHAIDERMVMDEVGTNFLKFDDTNNIPFYHEGLLSYIIGKEYHGSGITSDAGFYYRNSSNAWVGLNVDTVDDKHANGTMDSTSNATSDPTTGTNLVDHVNYLYTLTSALASGLTWLAPVTAFADLATTYPTPATGDSALVTSENSIYTYTGAVWVKTYGNVPMLSSTVSGIVNSTWYTPLYNYVTTPSNYLNQNAYSTVIVKQNGSSVSTLTAATTTDNFTLNAGTGLSVSVAGSTITLNATTAGDSIVHTDNIWTTLSSISSYTSNVSENVFLGVNTGYSSTESFDNIFLGLDAGKYITVSYDNIFIGSSAGRGTSARDGGYSNIVLGFSAGYNLEGNNNVIIGTGAGFSNVSGTHNVFLGFNAGTSELGSYRLYIEDLIYGEFDNSYLKVNGSLEVQNIKLTSGATNGYVLTSDASGNATWQSASAGTTYTFTSGLTEAAGTVKLGGSLIQNTTITGGISYDLTLISDNLSLQSNTSITLTVTGNVPASYGASVTVSNDNDIPNKLYVDDAIAAIVIPSSGDTVVYPTNNIWTSLSSLTTITGTDNTLLGYLTGSSLTTGSYNTCIGSEAGENITTGGANIFIGDNSGINTTTGWNNIFIGETAGGNNITGENNIIIGGYENIDNLSNILAISPTNISTPLMYGEFDNSFLKINGDFESNTSSVTNGIIKWKFEIDGTDQTKLHLKYYDGAVWNIVTTFDAN